MATAAVQPEFTNAKQHLLNLIEDQIRFQQRWRRINMGSCVLLTITALGSASAASVIAAMAQSVWGATFSAMAAFCFSAEKALLVREKWKLHVGSKSALESLKAELLCSEVLEDRMLKRFALIMQDYAEELPVYERHDLAANNLARHNSTPSKS